MTTTEKKPPLLLWLDVETTGLDPNKDLLLEVAWRVTHLDGSDQKEWPELGRVLVPHAPGEVDRHLCQTTFEMHTKSGLLNELEGRPVVRSLDADLCRDLEPYARNHILHPAGRNVGSFDVQFLRRNLPCMSALLSHKHFDFTALRLVGDLLGAPWVEVPFVGTKHRAMDDVNHDVACWRATLRALEGRKVLNAPAATAATPSPLLRPEIPSFDDTKRRLADLAKAYADGREWRIQARVDDAVRDFTTQLGDMDGSRTCGGIYVGTVSDTIDPEVVEARTRLAELFRQQGYQTTLKTTHVEIRLS